MSNVTEEVSQCGVVDATKCSKNYVVVNGVKSVPWAANRHVCTTHAFFESLVALP